MKSIVPRKSSRRKPKQAPILVHPKVKRIRSSFYFPKDLCPEGATTSQRRRYITTNATCKFNLSLWRNQMILTLTLERLRALKNPESDATMAIVDRHMKHFDEQFAFQRLNT